VRTFSTNSSPRPPACGLWPGVEPAAPSSARHHPISSNIRGPMADSFARATALASAAIAGASFGWQLISAWHKRHRITANLYVNDTYLPGFDFATVLVRNLGRPISIEAIVFHSPDVPLLRAFDPRLLAIPSALPPAIDQYFDFLQGTGALPSPNPGPVADSDLFPRLLADGESRQWAFRLPAEYLPSDPNSHSGQRWRSIYAIVRLTNSHTIRTNSASARLRPLSTPAPPSS
jgi:hypothetical protein